MDFDADLAAPMGGSMSSPPLSARQKAAVIVSIALAEGADLPLAQMPRTLQEELARQIAGLSSMGEDAVGSVVDEFARELGDRVVMPAGTLAALRLLDGRMDPEALAPLRGTVGKFDPWEAVGRADPESLMPVIEREATETAALIVSRLPTETAAEILSSLPGPDARRIAFAVSRIGSVDPSLTERIGHAIADEVEARPPQAFEGGAERRVGAILNAAPSTTRDDVLAGLREDDEAFADAVRRTIFTFADIATRLEPGDVAAALRVIDEKTQVAALSAGNDAGLQDSVQHLLNNMPRRMSERLREAVLGWSGRPEEGEAAMTAMCEVIRSMDEQDVISLRPA